MTNVVELFGSVDLNDVAQVRTIIAGACQTAGVGSVPADMPAWVAREFVERRQVAIEKFRSSVSAGFGYSLPSSIGADEGAAVNAAMEKHLHAAANKMDAAHSEVLLSAVIDLYFALHSPAPGGGQRKAA